MFKNYFFSQLTPSYQYSSNYSSLKQLQSSQSKQLTNRLSIQNNAGYELRNKINQKLEKKEKPFKKQQLRIQSSKKLSLGVKVRSLSNFVNQSTKNVYKKQPKSNILLKQPLKQSISTSRLLFSHLQTGNIQGLFNKSAVIDKKSQKTLDWSKKRKKKTRKLTQTNESENVSNNSSTTIYRIQQKNTGKIDKIQFKRPYNRAYKYNGNFSQDISPNSQYYKIDRQKKSIRQQQTNFRLFKKSDFQVGKKLGTGNFCTAYLVRHKKTGFICALKIMLKRKIQQENYESQIARQIKIQTFLKHPNIVQMYGVFQDDENIYLLLQFCPDGHLFSLIRKNSRLEQQVASKIVQGVCHGIQFTHRELVIHRDLKPENIFLCFGIPKIGDFGWAVYMDGKMRKTVSGSPLYFSPEIVKNQEYDQKIDIWGIGIITYQCLIGMAPFKVYSLLNLTKIVNDSLSFPSYVEVSREAIEFIQRCLAKRPQNRWSVQLALKHKFIKAYSP